MSPATKADDAPYGGPLGCVVLPLRHPSGERMRLLVGGEPGDTAATMAARVKDVIDEVARGGWSPAWSDQFRFARMVKPLTAADIAAASKPPAGASLLRMQRATLGDRLDAGDYWKDDPAVTLKVLEKLVGLLHPE